MCGKSNSTQSMVGSSFFRTTRYVRSPFIIPSLSSLSQSHSVGSISRRGRALLRPRISRSPVPFENGSTRLQTDRRPHEIGTAQPAVPETDGAGPQGSEKSETPGRLTPHSLRRQENLNSSLKLPPITSSAVFHNPIHPINIIYTNLLTLTPSLQYTVNTTRQTS